MKSNKSNKVLFLSDWYAPAYKAGGPVRSLMTMIDCIDNIDAHVICKNSDWQETEPLVDRPGKWIKQGKANVKYLEQKTLSTILSEMSDRSYGHIYFNGIYAPVFHALPLLYALIKNRDGLIVAPRGMLNPNAIALKSTKKKLFIRLYKLLGIESKVLFHSASEKESHHILEQFPKAKIRQISNLPAIPVSGEKSKSDSPSLLSVARISRVKNTDRCIQFFLDASARNASLHLIGNSDDQEYEQQCLRLLKGVDNIHVHGPKSPTELSAFYESADFFISPTSGENFGHAIIEALSHGLPVIISDQTPWNDLEEFGAGWVINLNDEKKWIKSIQEAIAMNSEKYAEMSVRAKAYVGSKFKIDEIRQQYSQLFHE